ncbi:hypothetical protein JCM13304A_15160 [Desulfothermus okinawensis JCM 13304]
MSKENACASTMKPSLLQTIPLSIKAIISEVHFNIIKGLRKWEIKDLKKRLDREYLNLGKLYYNLKEDDENQQEQIEVAKKQIEFLESEISSLEKQIENLRDEIIKKRTEDL